MSEFGSQSYTINGRTVYLKWILTNFDKIVPTYIGNKDITQTNYCGVNGTFFIPNSTIENSANSRTILWGIAMDSNGEIAEYGRGNRYTENYWNPNGNTPTACGTFVRLNKTLSNGAFLICEKIAFLDDSFDNHKTANDYYYNGIRVHQSDISWAIGGTSLFMDRTYSNASEYYADISDEDPPAPSSITRRTAIAYLGGNLNSNNMLLLTVFGDDVTGSNLSAYSGGVTLYELRQILKDIWNVAYHAIALDGGGSTQIQYKENGVLNYQVVNDSSVSGQKVKRKIRSILRVTDM